MPDTAGFSSVIPTKYCIFGCGTNGYNIIEELAKENERAVIVDRDESRVRHLRDQKYDAYVRDITASDMLVGPSCIRDRVCHGRRCGREPRRSPHR